MGRLNKIQVYVCVCVLISETAKTLINDDNARYGMIKVFEAVQDVRLNKHLFYVIRSLFALKYIKVVKVDTIVIWCSALRCWTHEACGVNWYHTSNPNPFIQTKARRTGPEDTDTCPTKENSTTMKHTGLSKLYSHFCLCIVVRLKHKLNRLFTSYSLTVWI